MKKIIYIFLIILLLITISLLSISVNSASIPDAMFNYHIENHIDRKEGQASVDGTEENDLIYSSKGNEIVNGLGGNDLIFYHENGKVNGNSGNDYIWLSGGYNKIYPGTGNDEVYVHPFGGNHRIFPSVGNKSICVVGVSEDGSGGPEKAETHIEYDKTEGEKVLYIMNCYDGEKCTRTMAQYKGKNNHPYLKIYVRYKEELIHEVWLKEYSKNNKWIQIKEGTCAAAFP